MSPQGKKLRTALVGFQFVVSIGLIIAALFMQVQNSFLRGVDTGMETEQVMVAQLTPEIITKHRHTLEEQLREGPQIVQVAYAGAVFGTGDQATMGFGRQNKLGEMINFDVIQASWSFPEVLGLKVVEGRTFRPEDEQKDRESYVFNQTAGRLLDLHEGDPVDGAPVGGIVADYNYKSLRVGIDPMAIVVNLGFADDWMSFLYIRFSGDPQPAMEHVRRTVRAIDPTFPVEFQFFDAVFNETYQKERKMTGLITGFSLLAVIISLVGVFGLVVFETQYRKKEIGVRRVHGATVGEILAMFNRRFVWIVAICFLVAAPLAWYGITEWLGNFAYRTPLHWWVFACSLLVVLLITLLTVTVQSWRAATENPVESLKSE